MAGRKFRAVISTDRHGRETLYPSVTEAARAVGIKWVSQISTACVTGNRCAGRHWRYASDKSADTPVQRGERVEYPLSNLAQQDKNASHTCPGTVVYVHPAERYHTVEFTLPGGKTIRRSFPGVTRRC